MKSKSERVSDSISNLKTGIVYLYKHMTKDFENNKVGKNTYDSLSKSLKKLHSVLKGLQEEITYKNDKLDEIRKINLSLMPLYEEGDYDTIFREISKINNASCEVSKEIDRSRLNSFKKIFSTLPDGFQERLIKIDRTDKGVTFKTKGVDNVKFLNENYLNVKYNFKKVKGETLSISDASKELIEKCNNMIKSNDTGDKEVYLSMKSYIESYSKSEIIIDNLLKIQELCDSFEYSSLNNVVKTMITKYNNIYLDNVEKYNKESSKRPLVKSI